MKFTVISTSTTRLDIARQLLPATGRVVHGERRCYFFYQVPGGTNYSYADVDGEPLIDCRAFQTLAEADAWVRADMQRAA